jgi:uncharacterized membrane protein
MTLEQFFQVSPIILLHTASAVLSLLLGTYQLLTMKGTAGHRILGYVWCSLMGFVAVSSMWIHSIDQFMGFSVIHLLSVNVIVGLPLAILAARRGNIARHRMMMKGTYVGGLIVAGIFTLAPGRILGRLLIGW